MSNLIADRLAKRGAAVLAAGLLLGVVPAAVTSAADAAVLPKVTITNTQGNYVSTTSSTATYAAGTQAQWFTNVSPDKTGTEVTILVQRFVNGTWFDLVSLTDALESGSQAGWGLNGADGGLYRAHITFPGDASHAKTVSVWKNAQYQGKQADIKSVKIAYALPGKASKAGVRTYKKNTSYATKVTVTRNSTQVGPNKANVYVEQYSAKTKKWVAKTKAAVTLTVSKTNDKIAAAKYTFKRAAGTFRVRTDYLGDASNSRAGSPWYKIVVK